MKLIRFTSGLMHRTTRRTDRAHCIQMASGDCSPSTDNDFPRVDEYVGPVVLRELDESGGIGGGGGSGRRLENEVDRLVI